MMYEQRAPLPRERFRHTDELWQPDLPGNARARRSDAYVVVDELSDERVTLAVAPWPVLDHAGRLAFDDGESTLNYPEDELRRAIDDERARHGQVPATRALRIGDAFLVRNVLEFVRGDAPAVAPADWVLFDVTASARSAAKVALHSAIAPIVSGDDPLLSATDEQDASDRPRRPSAAQIARPEV
jgi:hypothetical protein